MFPVQGYLAISENYVNELCIPLSQLTEKQKPQVLWDLLDNNVQRSYISNGLKPLETNNLRQLFGINKQKQRYLNVRFDTQAWCVPSLLEPNKYICQQWTKYQRFSMDTYRDCLEYMSLYVLHRFDGRREILTQKSIYGICREFRKYRAANGSVFELYKYGRLAYTFVVDSTQPRGFLIKKNRIPAKTIILSHNDYDRWEKNRIQLP